MNTPIFKPICEINGVPCDAQGRSESEYEAFFARLARPPVPLPVSHGTVDERRAALEERRRRDELADSLRKKRARLATLRSSLQDNQKHLNWLDTLRDPVKLVKQLKALAAKAKAIADRQEYLIKYHCDDDYYQSHVDLVETELSEFKSLEAEICRDQFTLTPSAKAAGSVKASPRKTDAEVISLLPPEVVNVLRASGKTDQDIATFGRSMMRKL